jgi:hypothetical protein
MLIELIREYSLSSSKYEYPKNLGQFDTNYVIFRNAEIFQIISFKSKNIVKDNSEYLGIFHLLKWIFQN